MSVARRIAVLQGGNSLEAEVSRVSAAGVTAALEGRGHQVWRLELDRFAARQLDERRPDLVFPALHGPPGEDGTAQGLLEMLELPYVGSGVHGSALAMDKSAAKAAFRRAGLPVAEELVFLADASPEQAASEARAAFGERIVIKPLRLGSAIGTAPLPEGGDPLPHLQAALKLGAALVEPFVAGREITVGVLDLHGQAPQAFPVIEIRTAQGEWYDYENRYKVGGSEHLIPAPLPASVNERLQRIALAAHRVLGLRDLSRADFIVGEDGRIWLLEVNTMPGMTPTSLYPDGAQAMGLPFPDLLEALAASAAARGHGDAR